MIIWGNNNPLDVIEHMTKSNVFCALSKQNLFRHFFFAKHTVIGIVYLDKLEEFLKSILEKEGPNDMLFQQDGALPYFHKEVTDFSNLKFPDKQIGRDRPITCLPRSPDLTPLDFFLWGVHQGCFVHATTNPLTGLTMCGLKLNTDMISAGPLMVPSSNICKM
jgi:hypothetical protein